MSKITFFNRTNGPQEVTRTDGSRDVVPAFGYFPTDDDLYPAETLTLIRAFQVIEIQDGHTGPGPRPEPVAVTDLSSLMPLPTAPAPAVDLAAMMPVPRPPARSNTVGRPKKTGKAG